MLGKLGKVTLLAAMMVWPQVASSQIHIRGIPFKAPPPSPRVEDPPPEPPSPRHQWITGSWAIRSGKQVWLEGRWTLPPAPGDVWEPPRWGAPKGEKRFYDGHWRPGAKPAPDVVFQPAPPPVKEVVAPMAPPPPLEEVRPPEPFPGAVWIPGNWNWNGRNHDWVAGRWSAKPAGFGWDPHKWEKRKDGKWMHRPAHWHPG
jgi:hypothetical protein